MEATLLLCDFAEELGGKLYMMGAGWNQLLQGHPAGIAIAVLLEVPWDQTNRPHPFKIDLVNEDGQPVELEGKPVVFAEGKLELGRPPGTRPGSIFNAPIAIRLPPLPLVPGGYVVQLTVSDELVKTAPFTVVPNPQLPAGD